MQIDRTYSSDSNNALKWAFIPIVSQGQMYNNKYLKSFFYFSTQSYCLNRVIYYNEELTHDFSYINIRNRNDFVWWLLGFYMTSIIDAYVDAELSTFPKRIY